MQKTKHTFVERITDTLEKNYMPYAMSVIVSRAIPEIDGFKPSHRKLLYTMYKMGLLTGPRTKSANVVGQTMKLNPHGDAAIYETMVRLTRGNAALLHPYVDSKGNFGKQYSADMQYAASRYTEVKLDKICETLFRSIDKDVVDFVPNYDGTMQEPTLLPAAFPSVLVNANQGIAVGMASSICPFNLREICAATIAYLKDETVDLHTYIKGPDFPGGGELIVNRQELDNLFETGRASLQLRSKYRIDRKNHLIEVYEIPYSTTVETIVDQLADLVKAGKVKEISDVRDETDLNGLKLTIELKRQADPEALMQRLFKQTSLQAGISCNFNLLIEGRPMVLGVRDIIGAWLDFRRRCVRRETAFDLARKEEKLHLLAGLKAILLDIDRAIQVIRETEKEEDVVTNLCTAFAIDEQQAEYIAEIRLRHLNREYLLRRIADYESLQKEIALLQKRLQSSTLIDREISTALQQISEKYGQDRCTTLIEEEEIITIKPEDLIEDYRLKLFLTQHGYLKKLPLTSLRSAGDLKMKEEDAIMQEVEAGNRQEILLFSSKAIVYKIFAYEIKDCKPSEFGEYLPGILDLDEDERIVFIHLAGDYTGSLLFAYENGKVSRVPCDVYKTKTKRKKLIGAYSDKAPIVGIVYIAPEQEKPLYLHSTQKRVVVYLSNNVPEKPTRSNQGIQIMTLKRNAKVNRFGPVDDIHLTQWQDYQAKRFPATGGFLKEETVEGKQISLLN